VCVEQATDNTYVFSPPSTFFHSIPGMKAKKLVPKVGALQRWVRDCDAAGGSATSDPMVWRVLDAMLRLADPRRIATPAEDAEGWWCGVVCSLVDQGDVCVCVWRCVYS
jgi:hypothetical protein